MNKKDIIAKTKSYVRDVLKPDCTGHDFLHSERVLKMALKIASVEKADKFVITLAALLHDLDDWKFNKDPTLTNKTRSWLKKLKVDQEIIEHVCMIIQEMPFQGARVKSKMSTLEGKIVQDADRLDALGAIGIARTFAYGGFKHRLIYCPKTAKNLHTSFDDYKNNQSTTINHFREKLLFLSGRMNTKTGQLLARKRHEYMKDFLKHFFAEWNLT